MIYLEINRGEYVALKYARNDKLVEEKNGRYDLEFEYPLNHSLAFETGEEIKLHNLFKKFSIIKCDTPNYKQQLFFITDIQKLVKGVKIYAKHIGFLSKKLYVPKFSFKEKSYSTVFQSISSTIADNNNFSFYSDISDIHTINMENKMLFDVLLSSEFSISTLWQGTYLFDNYKIKYLARRGKDTEYIVANRKNVNDINIKQDADNVVTRLYMKANKRTDNEKDKDVIFETVVESPLINEYPYILADFREYEDSFRTLDALKKYGENLFKIYQIDLPKESFSLVGTDEINSYNLDIDDTCIIYYEDYNIHKRIDVIGYVFSPMEFRYLQVDFGYKLKSLSDTLLSKTEKKITINNENLLNSLETKVDKKLEVATVSLNSKLDNKIEETKTDIKNDVGNKITLAVRSVDESIDNKIDTVSRNTTEKIEKSKAEIEKETKKTIQENKVAIEQLLQSVKTSLEEEIEKAKNSLDEEKIKALSNAETEKYVRSQKGQQSIIESITADVVWLKAVVTDTEILNTIVANIDLAKIKRLIVDTAFIGQIISNETFRQQFEDMGAEVSNIFSKLKNSITLAIQTKFSDKFDEVKRELNTALEIKSNEIISTASETVTNKIKEIQVGARNLLTESLLGDTTKWEVFGADHIDTEEVNDNEELKDNTIVKFIGRSEDSPSDILGYYNLEESQINFNEKKVYTFSADVKNLSDYDIKFFLNEYTAEDKFTVKAKEKTRIVLKGKEIKRIYVEVVTAGKDISLIMNKLKVEEGNVATTWTPALEDIEKMDEEARKLIAYLQSDNLNIIDRLNELKIDQTKIRTEITTSFKQTNDEFTFNFNNYQRLLDSNNRAILDRFNDISRYIRFINGNIELAEVNSSLKCIITNKKISFLQNNNEVAYISNNELCITKAKIQNSLTIGDFAFVVQSNGNLDLIKVVG